MKKKNPLLIPYLLLILIFIAGCAKDPTPAPEAAAIAPLSIVNDQIVSASGKVVAAEYANLAFMTSAKEFVLLVEEGQSVKDGERLAMIADDALPQPIILAEASLITAKRELSDLLKSEADKYQALQTLIKAQKAFEDAKEKLEVLSYGRADDNDITQKKALIDLARDELNTAESAYDKVAFNEEGDTDKARARIDLTDAREKVEQLEKEYFWMLANSQPLDVAEAQSTLSLAEADLQDALREYDRLKEGPDPQDVAAAEARVKAYQSVVDQKYLIAPFDGTVVDILANSGEAVQAGDSIILLANINKLIVQTTDLSEVDIARVRLGMPAKVTFDALPDIISSGVVTDVALKNASGSGVYYNVYVTLDQTPPELRWGMSAFVEITVIDTGGLVSGASPSIQPLGSENETQQSPSVGSRSTLIPTRQAVERINTKTPVSKPTDVEKEDTPTRTPGPTNTPVPPTETPTTETPEPTTETSEPTTETPDPTTETPDPTTETPDPTTETPDPTTESPEPTTVTPEG